MNAPARPTRPMRDCYACRGDGGSDRRCTVCRGSGEIPARDDADLAEALAAITHVDVAMFRRAREGAVLDADAVYTFSPMYAPRHPAACACDDCLDAELARLGTVLL